MPGKKTGRKIRQLTEDILLVLDKEETDKDVYILRVVSWNKRKPKLEKRSYWKGEGDSEMKMSKIVGLTAKDIKIIIEKKDEILNLLEHGA